MNIALIAGARPNFVKIAPLLKELRSRPAFRTTLIHTGQHYDDVMSGRFFRDLEIDPPDVNLSVGSGSHAEQTAEVMRRLEPLLAERRPGLVLVVGDVNSTVAAAITAVKLGIRVGHIEAGLRSFDRAMPEEINRILTDSIAHMHFVTEESGWQNLLREGVPLESIHLVGNLMIDALEAARPRWEASTIFEDLGLEPGRPFALLTLHRPSNVDDGRAFGRLMGAIDELSEILPILFPAHPRVFPRLATRRSARPAPARGETMPESGLVALEPLGYLDCIALMSRARFVLTDSGGIQEETTVLGVPCLTLRSGTERPVTVTSGTNTLVGSDPARIVEEALWTLISKPRPKSPPPLWDGRAAERIAQVLETAAAGRSEAAGAAAARGQREVR
ncbi:MAG TPA: UDP-N-acetylglucosamine 2-epimerase (non-hydrolyzing) [Candidatus Polarisedimenticolia bacterium]|nr:UDP-N-acetylglucosamine 2-epimerase (non-hydrolyzing) [Candidatus Polarisedimenticolia bacterium]